MTAARITQRASVKLADLRDATDEAQNREYAIRRRIKEIGDAITNNPKSITDNGPELERQKGRAAEAQSKHLQLRQVLTAVESWLSQLSPAVALQDITLLNHEPDDGETFVAAVEKARHTVEHFAKARALAHQSVLPIEDLRAQVDEHVALLARTAKPTMLVAHDRLSIRFNIEGYADQAIALLAWQDPEALRRRLYQDLDDMRADEIKRDRMVKSVEQRTQLLRQIDDDLLAAERKEEFLIVEALAREGTTIPRRSSASSLAILGVRVVSAAAAAAAA